MVKKTPPASPIKYINCQVCNNKISYKAEVCPFCGDPFPFDRINYNSKRYREINQIHIVNNKTFIGLIIAISFSIIIFFISIIKNMNLITNSGLISLFFSNIFFFESIFKLNNAQEELINSLFKGGKQEKHLYSGINKYREGKTLFYIGIYLFNLGILFLVSSFYIIFLLYISFLYILFFLLKNSYSWLRYFLSNIDVFKRISNLGVWYPEKRSRVIANIVISLILLICGLILLIYSFNICNNSLNII